MRTYVTKSSTAITGFCLVIENDEGQSSMHDLNKLIEDGHTLVLPDNPSGRRYLSIVKAQSADEVDLIPRSARTITGTSGPRSNRISFTEEELALLPQETVEVIRKAYESLQVNREKAKTIALIDKYKTLLAQLEGSLK